MTGRFAVRGGLIAAALLLSGCASMDGMATRSNAPATLTEITPQNVALRAVPPAAERIRVAVYDFPDLTGQYKEREIVQSLSRAVTQGGAPMLFKALQDAGERRWFVPLDRSSLDALLRERQIVTEMRRIYRGEERVDPAVLGPLDHAGIILQGGIVGYDTNTLTGGAGARYLGIGSDTQWELDVVTVSLRAVSTETGEVLTSVMVRKPIASRAIRGSVFNYVALDEILEIEGGYTTNEPRQVAVQQAIEKAVVALIAEGAELDLWEFANPSAGRSFVRTYRGQKYGLQTGLAALPVTRPETRSPAVIRQTTPRQPQPVSSAVRRIPSASQTRPTQAAPSTPRAPAPPPPPPSENETVG